MKNFLPLVGDSSKFAYSPSSFFTSDFGIYEIKVFWSPTGLKLNRAQPVQIAQQFQWLIHIFGCRKSRPVLQVNITPRERIWQVALLDMFGENLCQMSS